MESIPYGYCYCGCGGRTSIARHTDSKHGRVKGEPCLFMKGHGSKLPGDPRERSAHIRSKARSTFRALRSQPELLYTADFVRRFWEKVDRSGGRDACWPWTGAMHRTGYGIVYVGYSTNVPAHKVAFEIEKCIIPDGLLACHACDNRPCCNPAHIWPGTPAENLQDMRVKGRHCHGDDHWARQNREWFRGDNNPSRKHPERLPRGEKHPSAKYSDDVVLSIRRRYDAGERIAHIARELGITSGYVGRIARREFRLDI